MEEILIAPIHVMMSVMSIRGGQTKYSGHICNFPRHNINFYKVLPRLPEECDFFVLRRTAHDVILDQQVVSDTLVRRQPMQRWLRFFITTNHPAFVGVQIDEERLANLPENDSVFHQLPTFESTDSSAQTNIQPGPPEEEHAENNDHPPVITQSFIPNVGDFQTVIEQLHAEAHPQQHPVLPMPVIGEEAISEWDHIKIAIGAFPTLFPLGEADFNEPRTKDVKFHDWAAHLLHYEDGRFAKHPRFRYWALNTHLRNKSKKDAKWYMTSHKSERPWTVDDLRELLEGGEEAELKKIAEQVAKVGNDLEGSKPFWQKRYRELVAMVRQLCSPNVFITASAADLQWPDLHKHMPNGGVVYNSQHAAYRQRRDNLNENPAIAAHYFELRWQSFFEEVICKVFKVSDKWYR